MPTFLRRALVALVLAPTIAVAQHAFSEPGRTYDPAVPTPRAILGYDFGQRFTTHRAHDPVPRTDRRRVQASDR